MLLVLPGGLAQRCWPCATGCSARRAPARHRPHPGCGRRQRRRRRWSSRCRSATRGRGRTAALPDVQVTYGPVQVLFGVDLEVRRGRDRRAARHQRRRQVDAAQGHRGHRPPVGGRVASTATTSPVPAADARRPPASRMMPGGRRLPHADGRENLRLAAWLHADDERTSRDAHRARCLELLPRAGRARSTSRRRPLGRRAADARAGHGAHRPSRGCC